MSEIVQSKEKASEIDGIVQKPSNTLAKRTESTAVTKQRTRKRSTAKANLDAQGVEVQPVAKRVSPTEIATNRVDKEVAEIGAAYVDAWNEKLPVLTTFMEDVDSQIAATLTDVWGLNESTDGNGVSYSTEITEVA